MPAPPAYRAHQGTRWQNCPARELRNGTVPARFIHPQAAATLSSRSPGSEQLAATTAESAARSHHARHQRIAARNRSGALPVSDVIHFAGDHHNGIGLTGQRLCSWHRAGRGIGGINAAPAGAHSGKGKDFGGIAANGGRFQGRI
jgi:hypothetical protein